MKNLEKFLSILDGEVDGLLLTSPRRAAAISPTAAISSPPRRISRALRCGM